MLLSDTWTHQSNVHGKPFPSSLSHMYNWIYKYTPLYIFIALCGMWLFSVWAHLYLCSYTCWCYSVCVCLRVSRWEVCITRECCVSVSDVVAIRDCYLSSACLSLCTVAEASSLSSLCQRRGPSSRSQSEFQLMNPMRRGVAPGPTAARLS